MAQFEQHFVQDLTQPIKVRHCGTIVFNADNESNVVSVRLFNGSEPVAISGSVVGAVVCSDGSTVTLAGSYSGNTASITLTGDCFAILGQIGVGIQIVNGTQKTTVLKAIYNVEIFTTENVVDPGSRITLEVGDLIDDIETAVASIPADYSDLLAAIAPNYSGLTFPVKAGTFCWYNGTLYQAQQDIATSEAWTAAHWASSVLTTSLDEKLADVDNELSDLKRTIESDVAEITDKMTAVKSYNAIVDSNIKYGYAYTIYGVQSANASYNCTDQMIPVEPGDVIRFYSNNTPSEARIITVYTQDKTPWGGGAGQDVEEFTVPDNIYWINVTYYASIQLPMLTINYEATDYLNGGNWYNATPAFMPTILSSNVLNTSELLAEHSLTASGGVVENTAYATTGFIPVENSECLVATFDRGLTITLARVVAYDDAKNVIASAGATSVDEYTVPAGVSFIRFCTTNAYLTDPTARVSLNGVHEHYSPYVHGRTDRIIDKNGLEISNVLRYPFTTMRQDIVHNLAYKPLGPLSKGYVCVVSDDGNADVATYTIPMFIQKGVPCTLAMMKDSGVFGTTEGTNIVLDAVNNHDFCVAQHGGLYWTTYYDEYTLSKFFDSEKTFWDSLGITPYGACSPGHQCNDMIRAMTGGRFGCHRAAYFDGAPWYGDTMYINGPRSNMYSLTSQNIIEGDLDYWKQKCDTTLSNKWLMMIHLHEVELTSDHKTKLESVIDYALSIGLEFVTMKDIPTIV